ncbi:MAG: sensor histidine kinase, partial [Planctomycetota bacterium]
DDTSAPRNDWHDGIKLEPDQRYLRLEFATAGVGPDVQPIQYQLDGQDPRWRDYDGVASWSDLPPGDHLLRVRGAGGVTTLGVTVLPPWWRTTWFAVVAVAAVIAALVALYAWRLSQVRRRFRLVLAERSRMAAEIHDTLLQGVAGLSLRTQAALSRVESGDAESGCRMLGEALDHADTMMTEARLAIWDRPPADLDTAGEFADKLKQAAEDVLRLHARQDESPPRLSVSVSPLPALTLESMRQLYRIAMEAVTNAARHARATRVEITLNRALDSVELAVADDGIGFQTDSVDEKKGHWGLNAMRDRAQRLGGELGAESTPGIGTTIRCVVPAQRVLRTSVGGGV